MQIVVLALPMGELQVQFQGLAYDFNSCNPSCQTPIFDQISTLFQIPNLFSICLTPSSGGVLDLGFVDANKYNGIIMWTPISMKRWYNMNLLDIRVNGQSIGVPPFLYYTTNDVIGAFIDSGTSIILINPYAYQSLSQLFEQKYCNLPGVCNGQLLTTDGGGCINDTEMGNNLLMFPNLEFIFPDSGSASTFTLTVPPTSYFLHTNNNYCLGLGPAIGVGAVLGDVFMQNFYIVHDRINSRVGFANLKSCT